MNLSYKMTLNHSNLKNIYCNKEYNISGSVHLEGLRSIGKSFVLMRLDCKVIRENGANIMIILEVIGGEAGINTLSKVEVVTAIPLPPFIGPIKGPSGV